MIFIDFNDFIEGIISLIKWLYHRLWLIFLCAIVLTLIKYFKGESSIGFAFNDPLALCVFYAAGVNFLDSMSWGLCKNIQETYPILEKLLGVFFAIVYFAMRFLLL